MSGGFRMKITSLGQSEGAEFDSRYSLRPKSLYSLRLTSVIWRDKGIATNW